MANWEKSIQFVLLHEGGLSVDPVDPGGTTCYGISKRAYPDLDIVNLTKDEATEIYNRDYWTPCCCGTMDDKLALAVFDTAVNCGVSGALHMLNKAQGNIDRFLDLRILRYFHIVKDNPAQVKYIKGWINRVLDLLGAMS